MRRVTTIWPCTLFLSGLFLVLIGTVVAFQPVYLSNENASTICQTVPHLQSSSPITLVASHHPLKTTQKLPEQVAKEPL